MANVVVVGARGSGRTFFVGLLYAALVRYAGEAQGRLRFHVPPASVDLLGRLYESLRGGDPPAWPQEGPEEVGFSLDRTAATAQGIRAHFRLHDPGVAGGPVDLQLSRVPPEEVGRFVSTDGALTHLGSSLLGGGALVSLLDASALSWDPAGPGPRPHPWDEPLAALLCTLLGAARDHPSVRPGRLRPLFVLSKYDLLEPRLRTALLPEGGTAEGWTEDVRALATRTLLERFLPRTREALRSGAGGGGILEEPSTYITWVRPEPGTDSAGGPIRLKGHATADRGWEPDYPYLEYRDLIERLARLRP